MRIGELARAAACDVQTVRYYEKQGLLGHAVREANGYRHYQADDAERLHFIRRCRELDMSLREIQVLLDYRDRPELACNEVNQLLDTHIGRVEAQIATLRQLDGMLRELRDRCGQERTAGECGILNSLGQGCGCQGAVDGR